MNSPRAKTREFAPVCAVYSYNEYPVQTVFDITVLNYTPSLLSQVNNLLKENDFSLNKAHSLLNKIPNLVHHVNIKSNLLHVEQLFRETD